MERHHIFTQIKVRISLPVQKIYVFLVKDDELFSVNSIISPLLT
jgi:hypothetical protein